jgi:hypothetical protein
MSLNASPEIGIHFDLDAIDTDKNGRHYSEKTLFDAMNKMKENQRLSDIYKIIIKENNLTVPGDMIMDDQISILKSMSDKDFLPNLQVEYPEYFI